MHSIIQFENVGLLDLETQILNLNGKPTALGATPSQNHFMG